MGEFQRNGALPPLWPFLALCAVTAAWIDFGTVHRQHHADSIVPVLTSLYHWTPYYWETNRNGMLVPFLAIPFKNPLVNLLVQDWLVLFSALSTLFLLPRYMLRHRSWPCVGITSAVIFLLLPPEGYRFSYLIDQPYAVSMALGLSGLLLTEQPLVGRSRILRSLLALVFLCLSHWVNVGVGLLLVILVLLRLFSAGTAGITALVRGTNEEAVRSLLLIGIGFGFGFICMQLAYYHETAEGLVPLSQWLDGWRRLAFNTWKALSPHYWPIFLLAAAGLGSLYSLRIWWRTGDGLRSLGVAGLFVAAALLYGVFIGTLEWVARGRFMERYTIPSVIVIHTGLSVLVSAPLCFFLEQRSCNWVYLFSPVVLIVAAYSYGLPSLPGVESDLNARLGGRTADVIEARCTHIVGNYWVVWPAVFHANLVRYQHGSLGVVWGVSFRSDPTRDQLKQVPVDQIRIAVPHNDPDASRLLQEYAFPPLAVAERRSTVIVLRPPPSRRSGQALFCRPGCSVWLVRARKRPDARPPSLAALIFNGPLES